MNSSLYTLKQCSSTWVTLILFRVPWESSIIFQRFRDLKKVGKPLLTLLTVKEIMFTEAILKSSVIVLIRWMWSLMAGVKMITLSGLRKCITIWTINALFTHFRANFQLKISNYGGPLPWLDWQQLCCEKVMQMLCFNKNNNILS